MQTDGVQLKVPRKQTFIGHGALKRLEKEILPIFKTKGEICGKIMQQVFLKAISNHKKRNKKRDSEKPKSSWWPVVAGPLRD